LKEQAESEFTEQEKRRLSALRADLQKGVDQLDRGESVKNLDWDAFLAERHRNFDSHSACFMADGRQQPAMQVRDFGK
jgi:hypothetical protein